MTNLKQRVAAMEIVEAILNLVPQSICVSDETYKKMIAEVLARLAKQEE